MNPGPEHQTRQELAGVGPLVAAVQRRWKVVALVTLLLAVVGGAAGAARSPTYTAKSELSIGEASLATQSLAGYASAVQNLAGVYSRLVTGTGVLAPAARAAGTSAADLGGRVSAAPVPESSVFRVSVTAPSAASAIRQNRLVTSAAIKYISTISNSGTKASKAARDGYLRASRRASRKRLDSARLTQRKASVERIAETNAMAARYQQDAAVWAQRYEQNATATTQDFKGAALLSPAVAASDDRTSWIQKLALVGAAVGFLMGVALVSGLDRRRLRRGKG